MGETWKAGGQMISRIFNAFLLVVAIPVVLAIMLLVALIAALAGCNENDLTE